MYTETDLEGYSLNIVSALINAGFSDEQIDYASNKILNQITSEHPNPVFEDAFKFLDTEIKICDLSRRTKSKSE